MLYYILYITFYILDIIYYILYIIIIYYIIYYILYKIYYLLYIIYNVLLFDSTLGMFQVIVNGNWARKWLVGGQARLWRRYTQAHAGKVLRGSARDRTCTSTQLRECNVSGVPWHSPAIPPDPEVEGATDSTIRRELLRRQNRCGRVGTAHCRSG